MGVLETMVAIRDVEVDAVAEATVAVCADAGITTAAHPGRGHGRHDIGIWAADPWVVVRPHYVVSSGGLAAALTARLGALSSATSVYEDMFWTHHLVDDGRVLDRFCNIPGYFGPGEHGPEWAGDPDLVADVLGAPRAVVRPYFRQLSIRRINLLGLLRREPRAHRDDEFHLLDGWVTQDLWGRVGIVVPFDADPAVTVPLDSDGSSVVSRHLAQT